MTLNVEVHEIIEKLPRKGTQIFADMLSRFASDVVINIAHSDDCSDEEDKVKFLSAAKFALIGVETQLLTCVRLGHLDEYDIRTALSFCDEVRTWIDIEMP